MRDDRPNCALLVMDVQNKAVAGSHGRDKVIANINALVGRARAAHASVIWVQHHHDNLLQISDGWQLALQLQRDADPA